MSERKQHQLAKNWRRMTDHNVPSVEDKCHYCQAIAKYNDVAEVDQTKYKLVGVCECHSYKGLSS
jgi:hypothetical protein